MSRQLRTTCSRGCPDECGIVATLHDGVIVKLQGDPEHPVTQGVLCSQGNDYLKRQYAGDRLLYPLRRTSAGWEQVSWETALDLVAERLLDVRDRFGAQSVVVVDYGLPGCVAGAILELFWREFGGATFTRGGLSMETAVAAQNLDFGTDGTHDAQDLLNAAAIVAWGTNPYVTHPHWARIIAATRKRGVPLVAIDTAYSATAQRADVHYQPRPGSDGMLALGVARLLLERGAVDREFIERHSEGFAGYRDLVFSFELKEVAIHTGLAGEQIRALADLYADTHPVTTLIGHGPSYWQNGCAQVRLIDALAAISGNIAVAGGGAWTDVTRHPAFGVAPSDCDDGGGMDRTVMLPRLGAEILAADDPPIKAAWIAGANPAASVPDTNCVREALRSLEFLVVVEQFMTATAELADIVLPCATFLESDDLVTAYGHHFVGLMRRVVAPAGEAKTDVEILQLLAERLDMGPALAGAPDEWIGRLLDNAGGAMTLEGLLRAPQRDPQAVSVPFADRGFPTRSGRFRFVQEFEPVVRRESDLHLLAPKTRRMMNSQALPADLPDEAVVRVNPRTAARLLVADGGLVRVRSSVGSVPARLLADPQVHPEVALLIPSGWSGDPSGVNQLREARLTDAGEHVAFNETRVDIFPLQT
jgi:anaerobic selenocysteine-containing dehydrogenase